jgi:hypothetical protein
MQKKSFEEIQGFFFLIYVISTSPVTLIKKGEE